MLSLLSSASKLLDLLRSPPPACTPLRRGQSAVAADVGRLQRLLRRIQAILDDAGEREVRDSSVKLWIEELSDLARDAEDVLDDYRYDLFKRQAQEGQQTAHAVFSGSASTSSGKRTHDGDEGRGISEVTKFFAAFPPRPPRHIIVYMLIISIAENQENHTAARHFVRSGRSAA